MITTSLLGLKLPEGTDTFDYDVFLHQNFKKIEEGTLRRDEIIQSRVLEGGVTVNRPTSPSPRQEYFDESLGIPIYYWNGNWRNSLGAVV